MDNPNNLLGVMQTLWRWRKQIIRICVAVFILSIIISLFLPNYYKSSAVFYAASPNLAFPEPVGMESRETEYYGEKDDMDRILTIAESNTVADYLINKYHLYSHYDIDSTHEKGHYRVMKEFRSLYDVERTKFNAVEISIEDKDKDLATNMINDAWQKINELGQALIKESQRVELATRKRTVETKTIGLTKIIDSLSTLRAKYGIYNTATQSNYLTGLISRTQSAIISSKARIKTYSGKGGRYRDSVYVAQAALLSAEEQLKFHQANLDRFNEGMSSVEALEDIQEEASEQFGANRERLSQLQSTLESEFTSIYLVSPGEKPINKSRPMRSIIVLGATFIAFLFSVIGILLFESYQSVNWKKVLND